MSKLLHGVMAVLMSVMTSAAFAQQVSNANFEDWSGSFNGEPQAKGWNASNVEQVGMKFNFAHKETGRNGGYSMMVQDQSVGAMGITETSPGYFSLGQPWAYLPSITAINQATAGTEGGIAWTHRPDTMSVWIKRTGDNWDKEDFYLLYYSWSGTAKGNKYKGKNGDCTSTERTNEESDIRQALNGNECGTLQKVTQVAEGMWRERKTYGSWTNIRVPIYYMNNTVPTMMNIIFSASNYPNFRANSGLYEGNSLYVDDVEMIYSNAIQKLFVDGKEWKGFDPNSSDVQNFPLGEDATVIPSIEAVRGAGSITNAKGNTVSFPGRTLSGSEISISPGNLTTTPTTITVTSGDGKKRTYKIQFQKAASSNTKLAGISYQFNDKNGKTVTAAVADFNPSKKSYNVEIPYGATSAPVLTEALIDKQEDKQTLTITQAGSITGTATIKVTAPNKKATDTYTLKFSEAKLADNTLKGITVNGKEIPGFAPNQTVYKVSLPVGTTKVPEIKAVSEYPAGAQSFEYVLPTADKLDGGQAQIKVTTPGNPTPKIYKLNFKLEASSYSYLKNLTISGSQIYKVNPAKSDDPMQIAFEPDNLTYYVTLQMGATSLPTIKAEKGDEYQAEPVIDTSAGVDGTTRITATAANGDQTTYKIVFSTLKSEISTLSDLKIGGKTIEGFAEDKTSYDYALEIGTTELPTIEPVADKYATVVIKTGGVNGTTRITVTAGNGNTTVYLINFSVAAYTDNTLKSLSVEGYSLLDKDGKQTAYSADVTEYWVKLAKGVEELPKVNFVKQDEKLQTVNTRDGGTNGDYRITVRPQGGASQTYIIHFAVEKSTNNKLQMIKVDGKNLDGFDADQLLYTYVLPEGVSIIPAVSFIKGDDKQKVLNVLEDTIQTLTVTAESGDKRVYQINFRIQLSTNAFLEMIYKDGNPIAEPFDPEQVNYAFVLDENETMPVITVDKSAGQQITIISPVGVGDVKIQVAPEQGATNTYTISFTRKPKEAVKLTALYENDVLLPGFSADVTTYERTYKEQLPVVTCDTAEGQTINIIWDHETAWVHVSADGVKNAYRVNYTREYDGKVTLKAIKADGVLLSGFDPQKKTYDIELEAGVTYPALSYEAEANQRVLFGQIGEGAWSFVVTADNGTDTTKYTVRYTVKPYEDEKLKDIELAGKDLEFDENQNVYSGLTLDEGAPLPDMTIVRKAGQTVLVAGVNDTTQHILVRTENGTEGEYLIKYTRAKSSNAELVGILLDGAPIDGFRADSLDYIDTLEFRTKAIPTIFPIRGNDNQTIVTEYCYPNGKATINVTSQDGSKQTTYTIAFPVRKSNNTELEDVILYDENDDQIDFGFKSDKTDYEVAAEYQATKAPRIVWTKAEPEQRVDFISRPLGQTSELKVTAQNGDTKTYTFKFKETLAKEANVLKSITIEETNKKVDLKSSEEHIYDVNLPYNSKSLTVSYVKSYDEQTVFIQPGGIRDTTYITVKANRGDEEDIVYKLAPKVDTQNPAVLDTLRINGVDIPGFDSNRFTYIYNIDDVGQVPTIEYIPAKGARTSTPKQEFWSWEVTVNSQSFSNTYKIFFHYPSHKIPNEDFTEWVGNAAGSDKPKGWNATNDYVTNNNAKDYVTKLNNTRVQLYTSRSSTLDWAWSNYGAAPAMLNLASMAAHHVVSGGSRTTVEGTVDFYNTPDKAVVNYAYPNLDQDKKGAIFRFYFVDTYKTPYEKSITQTSTTTAFADQSVDLQLDGKKITGFDVIIDASSASLNGGKGADGSKLQVDYIHFIYNSTPKEAWVNGEKATLSGKVFTATIEDPEDVNIRSYEFNGQVSDQAQVLNGWTDKADDGNYAVRSTAFRNYAEDGTYTDGYSLTVKRKRSTDNTLKELYVGGKKVVIPESGTYEHHLKSTEKILPDVYPVPNSLHQQITCAYADSTLTITVKPEKGANKEYKVRFITDLSDDTELASLKIGDHTLDAPEMSERKATITAGFMPNITFEKKSDLQIVEVNNGVITVTAENGAQGTYTITRNDTVPTKGNGQLKDFVIDGTDVSSDEFGGTHTGITHERPQAVNFARVNAGDLISFTQDAQKMEWSVKGSSTEPVVYTLTYPVEKSNVAQLKELLINGQPWSEFAPTMTAVQKIYADSAIIIEAIPANDGQTMTIAQKSVAAAPAPARNGLHRAPSINSAEVEFTVDVKSEDESQTMKYTIQVLRPKSEDKYLADILVDGQSIEGFRNDSNEYVIILPSPAVKETEPEFPSIAYVAGHHGQSIEQEWMGLTTGHGIETIIHVTPEAGGTSNDYTVKIESEPSHCTALTGIMVNNVAVDMFEPGRHYYSMEVNTTDITIVPTSQDRFQTIDIRKEGRNQVIKVIAQDGVNFEEYTVDIFQKEASNDANLSNILLEVGDTLVELSDFDRSLNPTLRFTQDKSDYIINLPSGTTVAPSVSAQMKLEGQSVTIGKKGMMDSIIVTAPDGQTKRTYYLDFQTPKSKNANLSMIYLDGDSINNIKYTTDPFKPDYYFYTVTLREGVHELPEVVGQKSEPKQKVSEAVWDQDKKQATISVEAEDPDHKRDYILVFNLTLSDADTLNMIYADDDSIMTFRPSQFYYNDSLPVGSAFPILSWDEHDKYQTITMDTALMNTNTLVRQIHVTAESGKKNVYTLTYNIRRSEIDTLQSIYLDKRELTPFYGTTNEYFYTLSAAAAAELGGRLPEIEFIKGDTAQSVSIVQTPDSLDSKSLGYKSLITVTAPSGKTRTYIIHYPVEKSSDATLNMIMLSGKPIANFDSERQVYRLTVDEGADLPLVSVVKKEDAQTYDIRFSGDSIYVDVVAENGAQMTYSLFFERRLSSNALLKDLIVAGHDEMRFRADEFDYQFSLPYGTDTIPTITWVLQDSLQTVPDSLHLDTLETGAILATVTVVAPNKEDEATYSVTFIFEKNSDNTLLAILLGTDTLQGFDPRLTEYEYHHPFGKDSTAFYGLDKVSYVLSDPLATDTMYIDEQGVIYILVTAQNGKENVYSLSQSILLDSDNALSAILLDGDTIRGFDPDVLNYTYFVAEGNVPPMLDAVARSANAEEPIWREVSAGDTCVITVRAQDKSERVYRVHFAISTLNEAIDATAEDVLIKRIPGTTQIFIGTLRAGVTFGLYDQFGHPFYVEPLKITPANVNDADIIINADQREQLNDIYNERSGIVIDLEPGQIYLFGFYGNNGKKNIKSGKMMIKP